MLFRDALRRLNEYSVDRTYLFDKYSRKPARNAGYVLFADLGRFDDRRRKILV